MKFSISFAGAAILHILSSDLASANPLPTDEIPSQLVLQDSSSNFLSYSDLQRTGYQVNIEHEQDEGEHELKEKHRRPSSFLLKFELVETIERIRERWGVEGLTIGLVASPEFVNGKLFEDVSDQREDGQGRRRTVTSQQGSRDADGWWIETIGLGNADRKGNKVDNQTLFSIASNSKLFTALSVGLLIENSTILPNGEPLSWSTKIKDILPASEWGLMDKYAEQHADLIDLGSMRSGMPRHDQATGATVGDNQTASSVVANMRNLRPSTELRQNWQYNNHHYVTLARIVEYLTGRPFPDYVQAHILDLLEMSGSTYYNGIAAQSGHRSDGFYSIGANLSACAEDLENSKGRKEIKVGKECIGRSASFGWWSDTNDTMDAGPGGVITSSTDITKWIKELLRPTVLPVALVQKVTTGFTVPKGAPDYPEFGINTYGLGQIMTTYRGHTVHGHTGAVPGQHSRLVRLPELGFGFLVAVNADPFGLQMHEIISNLIVDSVLDLEPIDWETRVMNKALKGPEFSDNPTDPRSYPSNIEGGYFDKGYGGLNVTLVKPANPYNSDQSPANPDPPSYVEEFGVSLASVLATANTPLNVTGPIYMAKPNSIWTSVIAFTHFNGPVFNWTTILIGDELGSNDTVVGKISAVTQIGTAVFTDGGLGMFGGYWGQGPGVKGPDVVEDQKQVQEQAEVWYARV